MKRPLHRYNANPSEIDDPANPLELKQLCSNVHRGSRGYRFYVSQRTHHGFYCEACDTKKPTLRLVRMSTNEIPTDYEDLVRGLETSTSRIDLTLCSECVRTLVLELLATAAELEEDG